MDKKLLIALQCWHGDINDAMQVIDIIFKLGGGKRDKYADFMFITRAGCRPDKRKMAVLQSRNHLHVVRGKRYGNGHPGGCNALATETIKVAQNMLKRKEWDYDAIMLIEADAVPLCREWTQKLNEEWYSGSQLCLGYKVTNAVCRGIPEHVNGNCIIDLHKCDALVNRMSQTPSMEAWDIYARDIMLSSFRHSKLIFSDYRKRTITDNELFAQKKCDSLQEPIQPVYYHGVRDRSARDAVCKKFSL